VIVGLEDYVVLDAGDNGDELMVLVGPVGLEAPCPGCGVMSGRVKSRRYCSVRDSPAFGRPTLLRVAKVALRCVNDACGRRSFTPATTQVPARARVTTRARDAIGVAGRDRSTASVAAEYGVSWHTAWTAIKTTATRVLAERGPVNVTRLGVDETRFWWRQPWLTGLVDLDTGELLDIVCGRTGASVTGWLRTLDAAQRDQIGVVVVDPHAGYRSALLAGLPGVVAVVDRFHIAQLANKAITDVRRRRIWEQRDRRGRKIDPGWRARRDLLRRSENLTERGWSRVLAACLADTGTDDPQGELCHTWAAKEYLTSIYDTAVDRAHAHRQLLWWYCWVADHPVPELVTLATTISAWENEFLNYFDTRATNGRTEGVNRLIKHVKRTGFGYRNTDNYRLRILYRCTQLPSPVRPAEQPAAASNA
jgi:transposase